MAKQSILRLSDRGHGLLISFVCDVTIKSTPSLGNSPCLTHRNSRSDSTPPPQDSITPDLILS